MENNTTRVRASLLIWGDRLVPDVITKRLGIEPSVSYSKGDRWGNNGKERPFNSWRLNTEKEVSDDINTQFLKLHGLLEGKEKILVDLQKEYDLEYQLGIVIDIENDRKPAIYFDRWLIAFAHSINAQIVMDLYC